MEGKKYYIYILANRRNGTLYVGVTNNLWRRVSQHKSRLVPGFTSRYGVDKLVYYEVFESIGWAIVREKNIKNWKREWKVAIIEQDNPKWRDLFEDLSKNI